MENITIFNLITVIIMLMWLIIITIILTSEKNLNDSYNEKLNEKVNILYRAIFNNIDKYTDVENRPTIDDKINAILEHFKLEATTGKVTIKSKK